MKQFADFLFDADLAVTNSSVRDARERITLEDLTS
jgi:hypothetical protein